ncbi:PAS domain S-box protein [Geomonas nitrogeniifigens]|uniref:histidine kinase n=1 Tax=Geomonas diazotrophica TaxID=2843197 RepID=A0ABX8JJZ2_9BACT|nr:PAS domain S-box protein [Geomonas nitrogeniifigens]QWV98053.1 PAS domain S-box protein [Geomonas nitrogeniifigens]
MTKPFNWKRHIAVGGVFIAIFWLGDALLDATIMGRDPFLHQLHSPNAYELWMRTFYACLLGAFFASLSVMCERGRRVETALRHSDDLSQIFLDSSRDAICVVKTADYTIVNFNGVFLANYALTEEAAQGCSFAELVARQGLADQIMSLISDCACSGTPLNSEICYRAEDGRNRYEDISVHPIGGLEQGVRSVLFVARDITVRRISQERLEESEARYRAIFEDTGTAMAIILPDGTLQMVNRGFEVVTGLSREELEGRRLWTEFIGRCDSDGVSAPVESDLPGTPRRSFEVQLVGKEGTRTMAGNWAAIEGTDQSVLSLVDISAHKEVEEALRESRATLALAQRIARLGNWDWDLGSDTLEWSDEMYRIYDVDPASFVPTHELVLQAVHPEDREQVIRLVNDAIYNRRAYQLDYRIVLPNGSLRTLSARAEVTYDAQGRPLHMLGTAQDITWRIEAEQALRNSEEKFSKAFHASPDSIVITRAEDGTYIDVNEAFQEITGYSREEVIGRTSTEILLWADPDARMVMLKLLNEHGHVRNLDVRFRVKSGEIRELLWSADVIEYQGEACLIAISRDVTDQRQMERELLESDARLYMKHEELKNVFHQMEGIRREWEEIMDCISDLFILADQFGKIRRFNRAVETFTGMAHRDIVGRDCLAFLEEQGLKEHLESPGIELLHKPSGKWFVVKRHAFPPEVDGSAREVVIINDTTNIGRRQRGAQPLDDASAQAPNAG